MSDKPPRKKLRQSILAAGFALQRRLSEENTKVTGKMSGTSDSAKDLKKEIREKAAMAAETRMIRTSPNKVIPDVVAKTSEISSKPGRSEGSPLPDSQASGASAISLDDSESLFTESEHEETLDQLDYIDPAYVQPDQSPSVGTSKTELNTAPACSPALSPLAASSSHSVFIKLPYHKEDAPTPHPKKYQDIWDPDHVKMPCSPESLYPVEEKGKKSLKQRWEVVETALLGNMASSLDLEEAILTYNTRYCQKWDFRGLHAFFTEVLDASETQTFFNDVLPKMVTLAVQLPNICTKPMPLLKKQKPHSITFSQHQAASLLANAFFSTFPRRNTSRKQSEYSAYPDINFSSLFQGTRNGLSHRKSEKLKCILNYFRRVTTKMPQGNITFERRVLKEAPEWNKSDAPLTRLRVTAAGTIEDDGDGMLQIDFANKYLGGGVLGFGCVQEEIRFLICPEMILSRLFTEALDANESLSMIGCERFSNYSGYADTFMWAGDHQDPTPRDTWGRMFTEEVAIDALVFRSYVEQFRDVKVLRELNKAYIGFLGDNLPPQNLAAVATGNWGCGAFGGDLYLKALLQLLAAAEAKRDVCYFTFNNYGLRDALHSIHSFIHEKNLTVGDVYNLIQQYYQNECCRNRGQGRPSRNIYEYIHRVYQKNNDTDSTDHADTDEEKSPKAEWASGQSPNYCADTP